MKRSLLLLYGIFLFVTSLLGQTIPPDRTVDWSVAGIQDSWEEPSILINIIDFGGVGNGIADNSQALNDAMSELNGRYGAIVFPEGEFLFNSTIHLTDSVILKGSSSDETSLIFDLGGQPQSCISASAGQTATFTPMISGFTKGSSTIAVQQPELFNAGVYAEIRQDNGEWDTQPASWADHSVGQMVRVSGVSGDTLFLEHPLRIGFQPELNPEIRPVDMISHTGIECMRISRSDDPAAGNCYNIYFGFAANCRVTGVESYKSAGSHIYITHSTHIEVSGCYIHDAFDFSGSGTCGYGVSLNHHSGACLIENNIFRKLRHAMIVKTGANGNVFGYNYSTEPYRNELIHDYTGDISLHGHYAFCNLFEGNIVQNIILDHYWGPSGPYNTFFRNRAELYGIIFTTTGGYQTERQNIVGNEVTNTSFFHGLYQVPGENHFEFGNQIQDEMIPPGTTHPEDESCYLEGQPGFWNISDAWPPIGNPGSVIYSRNPSMVRYQNNMEMTVCESDVISGDNIENYLKENLVYPNPTEGEIYFSSGRSLLQKRGNRTLSHGRYPETYCCNS